VVRALKGGGKGPVSRNVMLVDSYGNRSEIDVMYGPWWNRTYIECKAYHGSGNSVGLEEVAKFKEVLSLNGVPPSRGLFITTSSYVPRARTTGVKTLDGKEFVVWERSLLRWGALRRFVAMLVLGCGGTLGLAIILEPSLSNSIANGWKYGSANRNDSVWKNWGLAWRGGEEEATLEKRAASLAFDAAASVAQAVAWTKKRMA